MEIPDAERDAGKEILYQVTQQGFNELLDPLFKEKEDLALDAAETKRDRGRYRHIYDSPWFESWAKRKDASDKKNGETSSQKEEPPVLSQSPIWPDFPEVGVEQVSIEELNESLNALDMTEVVRQVRQRSLSELLNATGYTVDADALASVTNTRPEPEITESAPQNMEEAENASPPIEPSTEANFERLITPTEALSTTAEYDDDSISPASIPSIAEDSPASSEHSYHDPTLPQFRPDTIRPFTDLKNDGLLSDNDTVSRINAFSPSAGQEEAEESTSNQEDPKGLSAIDLGVFEDGPRSRVLRKYLLKLRKVDRAEKEKEERGGWGRLNFEEWEKVVKTFAKEGKHNQMDYLGSWIDFCVPN